MLRPPAVAGRFYPADPEELSLMVDRYVHRAESAIETPVEAIIAPHAGYMFSGPVAGHAYKAIRYTFPETVVVISPSHQSYFDYASVLTEGSYETPLGGFEIDTPLAKAISSFNPDKIKASEKGHAGAEHALEVQLPFLQHMTTKGVKLVPVIMGNQSLEMAQVLADAIRSASEGKDVLIVASSDLSHHYPENTANDMDRNIVDAINSFDEIRLSDCIDSRISEACGSGPMMAAMIYARGKGADKSEVLNYATSADSPFGDKQSVVGYLAAVFYKSQEKDARNTEENQQLIPDKLRPVLLDYALDIIQSTVTGSPKPQRLTGNDIYSKPMGAFVTITHKGSLKGCIGYIEAVNPLVDTISEAAQAAASRDPRFSPLTEEELPDIEIEISVLSEMFPITAAEVVPGTHGLMVSKGYSRGLLLPQVATNNGWDRETFLGHTCIKANLGKNDWKDPETKIMAFTAEVFSTEEE